MDDQNGVLKDRVAVITGATAGIGRAIAIDLATNGCAVIVNGRRRERLDELVARIESKGGKAHPVTGDASEEAVIEAMLDGAKSAFGREADLVVINAGRGLAGSVMTSDPAQWESMYEINVMGAARMLRAAGARLAAQAPTDDPVRTARDIVVLGSNVGRHISPFSSMYGSSKFAVGALAEATRRELAPRGVRVTLVAPGIVLSEFQEMAGYTDDLVEGFREKFEPLLAPEDVARLVTFVVTQPPGVHACDIVIRPTRQDYP